MSDTIIMYENGKAIGGEGHPTNADEITFDNTGTNLVSENVEDAIVEVNEKLDTLDEDKADKTDIATVESGTTASRAYSVGSQFYFNDQLVTATANINAGGTITLGGNCSASDSVAKQINDLEKYVKRHTSGTAVTITLPYTTPSDGYIVVYNHAVYLESSRSVIIDGRGVTTMYTSAFVRKGQYIQEAAGSGTTLFVPLV